MADGRMIDSSRWWRAAWLHCLREFTRTMVDYVQLISRAVATLNPNTREARQALYQRARQTLVDKLRSIDPTLSHTDLNAERAALSRQFSKSNAIRHAAPRRRNGNLLKNAGKSVARHATTIATDRR